MVGLGDGSSSLRTGVTMQDGRLGTMGTRCIPCANICSHHPLLHMNVAVPLVSSVILRRRKNDDYFLTFFAEVVPGSAAAVKNTLVIQFFNIFPWSLFSFTPKAEQHSRRSLLPNSLVTANVLNRKKEYVSNGLHLSFLSKPLPSLFASVFPCWKFADSWTLHFSFSDGFNRFYRN